MIELYLKELGDVWYGVACDGEKVFGTSFGSTEESALQGLLGGIPFGASFQRSKTVSAFALQALALLKEVYDGKGASKELVLAKEHLSDYTRRVIEVTALIPVGYVASYGGVSKAAGGGPRAVGNVMASNPFAPIVPCHRVVASDFTLGGYGGGLGLKLQMLKRERRGYASESAISVGSRKLVVFPVEFVLKRVEKEKR